ncbi:TolB family protein [Kineococcus sp. SYSU DK018]|uniref:TolB family protein n=1 Tax=Kineococcus sp. SYSU DK018 TaxID=3383139 RepID=UPI003D7EC6AE
MKRTLLATLGAALAVALTSTPAAAQLPGPNGPKVYVDQGTELVAPCLSGAPADGQWTAFHIAPWPGSTSFSPSGRYLAISGYNDKAGEKLFIVDVVDCHPPRPIGAPASSTSWSPDGKQLAVSRNGDVEIISPQTGALVRNVTNTPDAWDYSPSWNPRGGRIAFGSTDGVRTVAVTGGASTLLARNRSYPVYRPDGRRIAYGGGPRIETVDADTGRNREVMPLTASGGFTYSPDGKYLFLTSISTGECVVATTSGRITERLGTWSCSGTTWGRKP